MIYFHERAEASLSRETSADYDGAIKLWDVQSGACLQILRSDRPYERTNITNVKGLSEGQKATLRSLGAVEDDGQTFV